MSSETTPIGAGESSPAPDGSEWEGIVLEYEAIDEEGYSEKIAVLNDLPRHWIGKRVRVTLIPNAAGEVRRNAVTSTGLLADESKGAKT